MRSIARKLASHIIHMVVAATFIAALDASAFAAYSGSNTPPATLLIIQVEKQNGEPIADARACLSLNKTGSSKTTSSQGRVIFADRPAQTHRLIVTKAGFRHIDRQVAVSGANQLERVTLLEGTSNPPIIDACSPTLDATPGRTLEPVVLPIKVSNFRIDVGSSQTIGGVPTTKNQDVTLVAAFDRTPGFFRVAETPDLSNAVWRPFNPGLPMGFRLNNVDSRGVGFGLRKVYFQAAVSETTGISSRVEASVILAPDQVSTRTLDGAQLQDFLSRATDAGYRFTTVGTTKQLSTGGSVTSNLNIDCPAGIFGVLEPDIFGPHVFIQRDEIRIFEGPPLNAFWKIFNVGITARNNQGASSVVESVSDASTQGAQQVPLRTIRIRSEIRVKTKACVERPGNFGITLLAPLLTSLKIEGPSNLEVKKALPPRN